MNENILFAGLAYLGYRVYRSKTLRSIVADFKEGFNEGVSKDAEPEKVSQ